MVSATEESGVEAIQVELGLRPSSGRHPQNPDRAGSVYSRGLYAGQGTGRHFVERLPPLQHIEDDAKVDQDLKVVRHAFLPGICESRRLLRLAVQYSINLYGSQARNPVPRHLISRTCVLRKQSSGSWNIRCVVLSPALVEK
jgi:hypothetical protein